jgi:hypothetical protein
MRIGRKVVEGLALGTMAGESIHGVTDGIIVSGALVRETGAGESNLGIAVGDLFAERCIGSARGTRESNVGAVDSFFVIGPTAGAKDSNLGAAVDGIVIAGVLVRETGAGESNSSLANGVLSAGVLMGAGEYLLGATYGTMGAI